MLLAAFLVVRGCKDAGSQRSPVFAVRGRLTIGGKPAEKAIVYFHPRKPIDGGSTRPLAVVQADGSFHPTTYHAHDGLPAGEYAVTVNWPIEYAVSPGEVVSGDDRLGARYSKLDSPPARVTIHAGDNELKPIDLE
ncbi:MAG: hypothetical protein K8T25_16995 [Planctomycetia bacterium]|nr:hypothetical protein [Planctomycetia bacterium]